MGKIAAAVPPKLRLQLWEIRFHKVIRAGMRANRPQGCGRSYGKFDRGCSVTLLITTLSAGFVLPFWVGAVMITSAFLTPSITFPNTVYFLSKAGCFFSVMNH